MYVQGVANFVDSLLGGLGLAALAVMVGSLIWGLVVLRVWTVAGAAPAPAVRVAVQWLRRGAEASAAIQGLKIVTKALLLSSALAEFPWLEYLDTIQVRAGLIRFAGFVLIACVARYLLRAPDRRSLWLVLSVLIAIVVVSGAWQIHAVGRLENRSWLMAITVIHQTFAAVWVGGVLQLLQLWRLGRRDAILRNFFPVTLRRFTTIGIVAVSALILTGSGLAWQYIGSWAGVAGTAYGSLVAVKVAMLILILGFAYLNFRAGRRWRGAAANPRAMSRVPFYLETETLLLLSVLFVAATVSSQPPAADISDRTASLAEVKAMFAPKWPRLESPTHHELLAGEPGRLAVVDRVPSIAAAQWSDYNHNIAGLFVAGMALLALLSYWRGARITRAWPLGFVGLALFLFFRSDAESWPLGPIGFWASTIGNGEVLQHRLATLLALALGIFEMRARTGRTRSEWAPFIFPALCGVGGVLLLTHAHLPFEIKGDYLIQSTHVAMGLLAVIMAGGRWLELRLIGDAGGVALSRLAGSTAMSAMFLIGLVLIFYREPLL